MLSRWLPWKFLVRHAMRRMGFVDPFTLMARLRRFAQPSNVQEPIELLRAGIAFHARGLINTRAIQHNLDWVWPYWVERQFSPDDPSFIPRAFSFSHVNLSHRNWTAVGQPDWPVYPIVDPRGLVTPLYDGWSVDAWVRGEEHTLLPSKLAEAEQELRLDPNLEIITRASRHGMQMCSSVQLLAVNRLPLLRVEVTAQGEVGGALIVAIRPYNPEGIQFIEYIDYVPDALSVQVEKEHRLCFNEPPDRVLLADYEEGDVLQHIALPEAPRHKVHCKVGMATAAAIFDLGPTGNRTVSWEMQLPIQPIESTGSHKHEWQPPANPRSWKEALAGIARLTLPDPLYQQLYDSAVRTLLLLSADEIVPGPYTYRRFWFRDASLMMNALLVLGLSERCRQALARFPRRQAHDGYFRSQEGEWDSNGQVLWIYNRYRRCTGKPLKDEWVQAIVRGARWIEQKRQQTSNQGAHAGLFPPGFSAEHFGPNDYYYWDDFWAVAGLAGAAEVLTECGNEVLAQRFREEGESFMRTILSSVDVAASRCKGAWPAAPYRRLDAGAIGVVVADYPLQLVPPNHEPLQSTIDYLSKQCFHRGAFFQDMIHSGINVYLTLTIAQAHLRAGNSDYRNLIDAVAGMASPTYQWPEAIHPRTDGGCMGDGQHGWAAAEWVLMIRNLFVREEGEELVLGSGLYPRWLTHDTELSFGPTLTPWGSLTVRFALRGGELFFSLDSNWRDTAPPLRVSVPGYRETIVREPAEDLLIERRSE